MSTEDTQLAECVRQNKAIYDKSCKEFKDKDATSLIWKNIALKLDMESGTKPPKGPFLNNSYKDKHVEVYIFEISVKFRVDWYAT